MLKKGDSSDIKSPECLILDDTLLPKQAKPLSKWANYLTIVQENISWK